MLIPVESTSGVLGRRAFLRGLTFAGAASLALSPGLLWARAPDRLPPLRIVGNPGVENATFLELFRARGLSDRYGLDAVYSERPSVSGPMEAIIAGEADLCLISAFSGVLPAIARGADLRVVGMAMALPALAFFAGSPSISSIKDLPGRRIGIGERGGLLHLLTLALFRKRGIESNAVDWVDCGSNAQVFAAVAAGKVDAGLSGPAALARTEVAHVLRDGLLWRELPEYSYQLAYSSRKIAAERPDAVARALAAFAHLYRFLALDGSLANYRMARSAVAPQFDEAEADAVWNFIHSARPYSSQPGISRRRVEYLQNLNAFAGLQDRIMAFEDVVDPVPAELARRLLRAVH